MEKEKKTPMNFPKGNDWPMSSLKGQGKRGKRYKMEDALSIVLPVCIAQTPMTETSMAYKLITTSTPEEIAPERMV
jgi:hypothetical protein